MGLIWVGGSFRMHRAYDTTTASKRGYQASAILADDARLDVRASGFWRVGQNAFFDYSTIVNEI